jgi:hypothetical protein
MDADSILIGRPDADELDRARIRRRLQEFAGGTKAKPRTKAVPAPGATRQERHRQIIELRQAGWTYVAIGKVIGLSRQRVAQIDKAGGRSRTRGPRLLRPHEPSSVRSA